VRDRAIGNLKVDVKGVNWFSTYRVHHRVALSFRKGRVFLLGDAAHIHSPVGGQGMNTGIGDAVNLAWKLASAVKNPSSEALLESYEPERIAFARRLVATTDRAFTGVISPGAVARFVRTRAVPDIAPGLFKVPLMRRFAFRTVSQIGVNYRRGPLSFGKAGSVHGGDRLPWVKVDLHGGGGDNHSPLASLDWQIHVYGHAKPRIKAVCESRKMALHVFSWRSEMERAGLLREAVYLVRPDGYVAMADADGSSTAVISYLDQRRVKPVV
jgi:FAD binding domain